MKVVVYQKYGPPDVLHCIDIATPAPKDREILLKIHATVTTLAECAMRKGDPYLVRLFTGLFRPKRPIPGDTVAGEVVGVGANVARWKVGDKVFGTTGTDLGACAEYKCLPEDAALTRMPHNVSYEEAAAMSDGFLTSLPFLRDEAKLRAGQRILINGVCGSVGSMAVQLAMHYGAEVTGVCSESNFELAHSLGADRVIDYNTQDFTSLGDTYDVVFDTVGKSSFSRCRRVLTRNGVYLTTVPTLTGMLQMLWTSKFSRQKCIFAATGLRAPKGKVEDLAYLRELAEAGKVRPVIDRRYELGELAQAHRYVEAGRKKGNVVVRVAA